MAIQERLDSLANRIANPSHVVGWFAAGVRERPILTRNPRRDGTLFAASHGDQQSCASSQIRGQETRTGVAQIDADLLHRIDDLAVDTICRVSAGGDCPDQVWPSHLVEEGSRHLRPTGAVNAGEDHSLHGALPGGLGRVDPTNENRCGGSAKKLSQEERRTAGFR
jgi:hypothetical protein